MKNKITLLLFLAAFLSQCTSNNDSENPDTLPTNLKIKRVLKNNTIESDYTYNSDSKVSIINYYNNGSLSSKQVYEYIADVTQISHFNSSNNLVQVRKYYEVNATTIRRDRYDNANSLLSYFLYKYTNTSCSHTSIETYNPNNVLTNRLLINYTDTNCSWESDYYNANNHVTFSSVAILDDKKSAYASTIIDTFSSHPSVGNQTEVTNRDANSAIINSSSYTSLFTYNSSNYPTIEVRTYIDGTIDRYTFEYY